MTTDNTTTLAEAVRDKDAFADHAADTVSSTKQTGEYDEHMRSMKTATGIVSATRTMSVMNSMKDITEFQKSISALTLGASTDS